MTKGASSYFRFSTNFKLFLVINSLLYILFQGARLTSLIRVGLFFRVVSVNDSKFISSILPESYTL